MNVSWFVDSIVDEDCCCCCCWEDGERLVICWDCCCWLADVFEFVVVVDDDDDDDDDDDVVVFEGTIDDDVVVFVCMLLRPKLRFCSLNDCCCWKADKAAGKFIVPLLFFCWLKIAANAAAVFESFIDDESFRPAYLMKILN